MVHNGFMNIYRSGFFHRAGKPSAFDRHAGDMYATREAALADINPASHYVDTVPVSWQEPAYIEVNPANSIPRAINRSAERKGATS